MTSDSAPRFRFAPSPTGAPHVGSLHTALFSWALARAGSGDFILRIDDTDSARNTPAAVSQMLEALRWLGLDWDEGPDMGGPHAPYYQSQRFPRYRELATQLHGTGHAYYGDDPSNTAVLGGQPLRLRLPRTGTTAVEDALRGPITFENGHLEDPVLLRSDGSALYHLANVADDHDMAISHVVRGADWIATTPYHIHLFRALGWELPVWIHLPLIRNHTGQKLSKRDAEGGYLVSDFQEAGYLPAALFNYLLLLGWSPPGTQEIVDKWDVRKLLHVDALSASPAVFDWDKLNWLNRQYLQRKSNQVLVELARPFLETAYDLERVNGAWLEQLIAVLRDDLARLADVTTLARWALADSFPVSEDAVEALAAESANVVLVQFIAELAQVVLLDEATAGAILQGLKARLPLGAQQIYWPIRAALTGAVAGPPLAAIMALLGRDRCMERCAAVLRASAG